MTGSPYGRGAARWRYYYGPHLMGTDDQIDLSHGMLRDAPRTAIPNGYVYDASDFLFYQPGVASKRGGTSYAGPALTGASYTAAVAYAEFPAGAKLLGIDDRGHLFTVTSGSTTDISTMGAAWVPIDKPKTRIGGGKNLLVIPVNDGTSTPKTYDGTTVAALGGTPPTGKLVEVYKSRVLLGNTSANPNRLFFSPTPDPTTTWDTSSWIDFDYPLTGLAATSNMVVAFSQGHAERLTGSTPPPNSDMDRAPIGNIGTTDARSIVVSGGDVIFANTRGVYLTNGTGYDCLTKNRISSYWRGLFASYDPATWVISAGLYAQDFLIVNVFNNSGTNITSLVCYLPARAWWRNTNINGGMFASALGTSEELYYADRNTNRVTALSGTFAPADGNRYDADGSTAVAPTITYRMPWSPTLLAFGSGYLTYAMGAHGTDAPTLACQIYASAHPADPSSFTAVAESPFSKSSTGGTSAPSVRKRFTLNTDQHGVHVKLVQSGASTNTDLYALELENRPYPNSALG